MIKRVCEVAFITTLLVPTIASAYETNLGS